MKDKINNMINKIKEYKKQIQILVEKYNKFINDYIIDLKLYIRFYEKMYR